MQRSFLLFSNSIHSKESLKTYTWGLNKFMEFYKLKDYDSLALMDSKMLQVMIEDFIMTKKSEGMSRSGIVNYTAPLELFCDTNDLNINWKKIHRLMPKQEKKSGGKPYTTEQIAHMLSFERDIRNRAIIHFLASSGVRIGSIEDMKLKHVVDFRDCKIVTVYADTKDEYTTFLTPEASRALDQYIQKRKSHKENITEDSPLFRTSYRLRMEKAKPMRKGSLTSVVERVVRRAGLRNGKLTKRYDTQLDHGFRKRWNTIVKNTDGMKITLAEKMMGHSVTIPLDDTYNVPESIKLFEEFSKAIPELTIDKSTRQKEEIEKLTQEKSELEEKNSRISDLEKKFIRLRVEQDDNKRFYKKLLDGIADGSFKVSHQTQEDYDMKVKEGKIKVIPEEVTKAEIDRKIAEEVKKILEDPKRMKDLLS